MREYERILRHWERVPPLTILAASYLGVLKPKPVEGDFDQLAAWLGGGMAGNA